MGLSNGPKGLMATQTPHVNAAPPAAALVESSRPPSPCIAPLALLWHSHFHPRATRDPELWTQQQPPLHAKYRFSYADMVTCPDPLCQLMD